MESKIENTVRGLVLSLLLLANVASSALNDDLPSTSPLTTNGIEINQATGGAGGTSLIGSLCQTLMSQYGPAFVNFLTQNGNTPQQACSQIGLCVSLGGTTGAAAGAAGAAGSAGVAPGGLGFGFGFSQMLCGPCQLSVAMMQQNLKNKQQHGGPNNPAFGFRLCQSISSLIGNPALVYSPPALAVQSVSEENAFQPSSDEVTSP